MSIQEKHLQNYGLHDKHYHASTSMGSLFELRSFISGNHVKKIILNLISKEGATLEEFRYFEDI